MYMNMCMYVCMYEYIIKVNIISIETNEYICINYNIIMI